MMQFKQFLSVKTKSWTHRELKQVVLIEFNFLKLLKANTASERNLNPWQRVPVSCENSVKFSHRRKLSPFAQQGT